MAPKLMKEQVNNDINKQSLYNKKNTYGKTTMIGIANLVRRGEINLTKLDSLNPDEIKRISKELQLKISSKSNKMIMEEIKHVARTYIAGQGKNKHHNLGVLVKIPSCIF